MEAERVDLLRADVATVRIVTDGRRFLAADSGLGPDLRAIIVAADRRFRVVVETLLTDVRDRGLIRRRHQQLESFIQEDRRQQKMRLV